MHLVHVHVHVYTQVADRRPARNRPAHGPALYQLSDFLLCVLSLSGPIFALCALRTSPSLLFPAFTVRRRLF